MNLTLKTQKPEMSYLNYSHALWDCLGFQVDNIWIAESGNIVLLGK